MPDYTKFSAWKKFLSGRDFQTDSPFTRRPLSMSPVFLYSEMCSPLPDASMGGGWTAYAAARQLAAHLRFGLLPCDFSIWLCRSEWDSDERIPKTAEMIFEGAQSANNRYVDDIPLMKKVIAELDAALETNIDSNAWSRVQKACRIFNARWLSTTTWNFVHRPLRDIRALARDMAAHGSIVQEQAREMKALGNGSLAGRDAQRKLRSLLKDAAIY